MANYYNPYLNPYINNQFAMQDLQSMRNDIDRQIRNIQQQQQQTQMQQPAPITQNFSLAPNPTNTDLEAKYADNVEEVKNTFVMKTGIFTNKDFSKIWVKDVTGNIRTFSTREEIKIDEKDKALQEKDNQILSLQAEINELKEIMSNGNATEFHNTNNDEQFKNEKSTGFSKSSKHSSK